MSEPTLFSSTFKKYAKHLRALGYENEEVTLMMIGYAAGWNDYEQVLDRIAKDVKKVK